MKSVLKYLAGSVLLFSSFASAGTGVTKDHLDLLRLGVNYKF